MHLISKGLPGPDKVTTKKNEEEVADKVVRKRFGFYAVEKGFIKLDQLIQAMKIQVNEDIQLKPHRRIGEILVELGLMNQSQVDEILAELDYFDKQYPAH